MQSVDFTSYYFLFLVVKNYMFSFLEKMDKIHDPDNRSWISELIHPAEILDKFKEEVNKIKPLASVNETSIKPHHLKSMTGIPDDKTFKELESAMNIDNLTLEGECHPMQIQNQGGSVYGLGVPKFYTTQIPEAGRVALKTLFFQQKYLKGIKEKTGRLRVKRSRMHYEDNDNWWLCQPYLNKHASAHMTDSEKLYCVRVYRPIKHLTEGVTTCYKDLTYTQEIWLLGRNTLSELRDMISCSVDNNIVGKQQVDTLRKLALRAGDVYKSGFIYINGCFYIDRRHPTNIDYSQVIRDWVSKADRGIGPLRKGVMESTTLADLELRVGYPYLYTHQGNHEHLLVFNDVRLVGPEDPQNVNSYPLVRSLGIQMSRHCMVCQTDTATWVTEDNARVSENPFFFCTLCYKRSLDWKMSDDEREIDVEDDGEMNNDSGSGGMSDSKRALHNAMERKRRDSIKDSFRGLQDCIPTLRGDKTSRAQVLKKTGDYISQMQQKISKHQSEISDLKTQNAELEAQIRAMEKAKTTFGSSLLRSDSILSSDIDITTQVNYTVLYFILYLLYFILALLY
ncbi:uncharacterized protein LOC111695532 [Eurytemora carolleeae]|uniref:uncharacterized protein LOC111695532 n=1 Tax=Eurytemora carolleeae TaxID=1294199 RepID=UPI000C776DAB|nr:uncharacterized protein LOC111695532 [Eurytemora carolleeae]|eukprot:XP_023320666.1 uncharacterized protein LOC111695532 [Eurytemora affinis]